MSFSTFIFIYRLTENILVAINIFDSWLDNADNRISSMKSTCFFILNIIGFFMVELNIGGKTYDRGGNYLGKFGAYQLNTWHGLIIFILGSIIIVALFIYHIILVYKSHKKA